MLKALILFLEVPILILVPLVDDVHSCDKFIEALIQFQIMFFEALILDFKALFEYLEEGIQRNRFGGCSRVYSRRALPSGRPFIRGITGLCFGAEAH